MNQNDFVLVVKGTHALIRNSAAYSAFGERKCGELGAVGSKLNTSTKKLKKRVIQGVTYWSVTMHAHAMSEIDN